MKKTTIVCFVIGFMCTHLHAATITPGNLLISTGNQIYENTTQGNNVQIFTAQYPGGYPATEYARDIAADTSGRVFVYNGTFSPYMSTFNSDTSSWNHVTYSGYSTVNNGSYGGIDVFDTTAFVTDMLTYSGGEAKGVIAFDTETGQAQRFAESTEPIDLTMGLDGLLYTLSPGGSPGGRIINVYDPSTFDNLNTIDLSSIFGWTEHRSIAVDYNGDIFIADWDGEVNHINKAGELIATITPTCDWIGSPIHCEFNDIDISQDGEIALGTRFGEVIITDTEFANVSKFNVGTQGTFVEFVPRAIVEPVIPVAIDIKPGSYPNIVNLRSKSLPVAILTTGDFDATTVDPSSVTFGPGNAIPVYGKTRKSDIDRDGDIDLTFYFKVNETGLAVGDTVAGLSGKTFDGKAIEGFDSVIVVNR